MIFDRLDGEGQFGGDLFVGHPIEPAHLKDLSAHGGHLHHALEDPVLQFGLGEEFSGLGIMEGKKRSGQLRRHPAIGLLLSQQIDQRGLRDPE